MPNWQDAQPPIADQPRAEPATPSGAAPSAAPPIVAAAPPAPRPDRSASAPNARSENPPPSSAPPEALASAARLYRVFAQVGPNTPHEVVDALRDEAGDAGFGIQRKVEQVRLPVMRAEVRYNGQQADGEQVAADARKLAAWMEVKLGRKVEVKDIGASFPSMASNTLELAIPGPDLTAGLGSRLPRIRIERAPPAGSVNPAPER
jgi:hypothetical protein